MHITNATQTWISPLGSFSYQHNASHITKPKRQLQTLESCILQTHPLSGIQFPQMYISLVIWQICSSSLEALKSEGNRQKGYLECLGPSSGGLASTPELCNVLGNVFIFLGLDSYQVCDCHSVACYSLPGKRYPSFIPYGFGTCEVTKLHLHTLFHRVIHSFINWAHYLPIILPLSARFL